VADFISKKTRLEFREHCVTWTCGKISAEFDAADVPCSSGHDPQIGGQRRSLVEQYYHAVDFSRWEDARRVLDVYANALGELEDGIATNTVAAYRLDAEKTLLKLTRLIERDGVCPRPDPPVLTSEGVRERQSWSAFSPLSRSICSAFC